LTKTWFWVLFQNNKDEKKMIYNWYPIMIGEIKDDQFITENRIDSPYFFRHLRGSTNGVNIGDEIWFMCHSVSYEDRRYYYHIFVVLDAKTYQLKKYTPFFTFTKEKVEYSLGFIYQPNGEFLIGYSVLDRMTDFITITKKSIDDMMIVI
jgi:hypothetical protein